jgi:hypothetical protein
MATHHHHHLVVLCYVGPVDRCLLLFGLSWVQFIARVMCREESLVIPHMPARMCRGSGLPI